MAEILYLSPDYARHGEPFHRTNRQEQQQNIAAEYHHEQHDEDHKGQGIENIHQSHHYGIDPPAGIACHGAPEHADHQSHASGNKTHQQRDTAPVHNAGEHIPTKNVCAEPVCCRRR